MERVASGYALAEAPVAAPDGGVYFSDFLAGGVYHFSPRTGEVETIVPKRRGVGGMALHADGGLVMTGRDVVHVCAGQTRTLYANPEKTILNDLTIDSGGRAIVGCLRFNPLAGETPVAGAFMRLDETVVMPGVLWANGCALSPDGDTFYGCDYHRGLVLAVEHNSADEYGPPRTVVVSPSGVADGLAIDEDGCLWVALGWRASVGRFTPAGDFDAEIAVDADFVASMCFAGTDRRDLFITTAGDPKRPERRGSVFVTRAPTAGVGMAAATD
jgi:xylono-1,5-lactonase